VPKVLADMHIPPAFRRWGLRFVLAIVVAVALGYLPGEVLKSDPRTAKLRAQIDELDAEAASLAAANAALAKEVDALATDIGAIEDRARADLGVVYPDEVVIRVEEP
jgi:cell division protein FtsB